MEDPRLAGARSANTARAAAEKAAAEAEVQPLAQLQDAWHVNHRSYFNGTREKTEFSAMFLRKEETFREISCSMFWLEQFSQKASL